MMTGSTNALKWFDTFLFATARTKTLTTNGSVVRQLH
jgi:hypothetical protein